MFRPTTALLVMRAFLPFPVSTYRIASSFQFDKVYRCCRENFLADDEKTTLSVTHELRYEKSRGPYPFVEEEVITSESESDIDAVQ